MHAISAEDGQPLLWAEADAPLCGPDEVRIEVHAAGLNRADLIQRKGAYPPPPGASTTMGLEVAGIITEVGTNVSRWKAGARVCALLAGGGYAEQVCVDAGSVLPVSDGMDFIDACCFPEAVFTVWANVFDRVGLKSGEGFLCHGGTSGIGVMAIQMARQAGASKIYTTAGSDEKCALAASLGADVAINYRTEDFVDIVKAGGGVDVILDMVGGDYVMRNIQASNLDGRIINIAYQNGFEAKINFAPVLMKRLTLAATTLRARPVHEKRRLRDALETHVWPGVLDGTIKPVLDSTFAFEDAEAAHAHMSTGGHSGKIILKR
jgi:putative PIG3 family NAD(P)H quinone oxidoreductase